MNMFWFVLMSVLFLDVFDASAVVETPEKTDELNLKRSKRLTTFGGGASSNQNNNNNQQNNQNKKPLHQPCRSDYDCGTSNSECRTNASSYNPNTMMCYCKENYEEVDNECSGAPRTVSQILLITSIFIFFKFHHLLNF